MRSATHINLGNIPLLLTGLSVLLLLNEADKSVIIGMLKTEEIELCDAQRIPVPKPQ